jgi:hypothetical protein
MREPLNTGEEVSGNTGRIKGEKVEEEDVKRRFSGKK